MQSDSEPDSGSNEGLSPPQAAAAIEAALRASEARLEMATEAAGIGVWDWNLATDRLRCSARAKAICGFPSDQEVTVEAVRGIVHPHDLPLTMAQARRAVDPAIRERATYDCRIIRADGSVHRVLAHGEVLFAEMAGAVRAVRYVGTLQDITERKAAEVALRESEARYRALIELSPDAIHVHQDGIIILANARAVELFGAARPEELIGCRALALIDPASLPLAQDRTQRLWAPGDRNEPVRMVVRRLDGRTIPVEASSAAVLLNGRLAVQAVLRDVAARERAEAALRESEARFRSVADTAPVLIWMAGPDKGGTWFNRTWLEFTGCPMEAQLGDGWLASVHLDDHAALQACAEAFDARQPFTTEFRLRRADGQWCWMLDNGVPRIDAAGDFLGFIGSCIDITERKVAEQQQRLLLLELSHRVKNTLAVVQVIAARTLLDGRPIGEAREALNQRLYALSRTHDLLTASEWRGARLQQIAERELTPFGGRVSLAGADIVLTPKAALILALALHELATNAAKHGALSQPGGWVTVRWGLERSADGEPMLRLRWRERDGPAVMASDRAGFGRSLLEQGLRYELGGEVELDFRAEGVRCEVGIPARAALVFAAGVAEAQPH